MYKTVKQTECIVIHVPSFLRRDLRINFHHKLSENIRENYLIKGIIGSLIMKIGDLTQVV